jgi:UDP-N-acetylglucosamine 2-epimerase (non-hydrolysing)
MKVMTVLGTRPEIIRLSIVIEKLDALCEQVLVHTGQNYDSSLNEIFFEQLNVRQPDHYLGAQGSLGEQLAVILPRIEQLLNKEKPDKFLILGDTNSALSAIVAKRMSIPVYHMEAGNRCYDDRVPEEVNRRIIDHCSDVLMPYTERSRQNLIREGIQGERIYVTGNPILEVLTRHEDRIQASNILEQLKLKPKEYFLVTMHRAENVDIPGRLKNLLQAFDQVYRAYNYPVIVSTHPHTRERMKSFEEARDNTKIRFLPPFGLFDFIKLEKNAFCVLSDSGTVQEECAIFKIPNVTIRDVTERPETLECGSNILSGGSPQSVLECVKTVTSATPDWDPPREYLASNVSSTVIKILQGHLVSP